MTSEPEGSCSPSGGIVRANHSSQICILGVVWRVKGAAQPPGLSTPEVAGVDVAQTTYNAFGGKKPAWSG